MPKSKVFYKLEWIKVRTTWKWILTIFRYKNECYKQLEWKKYMKDRFTWLVFMFPFCFWYLIVWKVHFLQFFADLSKNLSLLKKLTWMHVKGLVMLFKKMVFFIMLWLTVSDFLLRSRQNSKKVKKETWKPCKLHHFFHVPFQL